MLKEYHTELFKENTHVTQIRKKRRWGGTNKASATVLMVKKKSFTIISNKINKEIEITN